ncbi:hypothetical protein PS664_04006 [Pseudomonas fluorescens]|nr:hypothetical protein PS664_04006 [Pseudomonas fluorescens]
MNRYSFVKPVLLASLFVKEQLKEPVALFWSVLSPSVTYYLITYSRGVNKYAPNDYLSSASWFYSFVASSVALFGLAFYIVGRRESGFLRSFVYTDDNKIVFLFGRFLAYSIISLVYCCVFYVLTRSYNGVPELEELFGILGRFYICFLLFSIPALLLTLAPLGFQNSSTVFSIVSLAMLALGIVSIGTSSPFLERVSFFNPMWWANHIMLVGVAECWFIALVIGASFFVSLWLVFRFLTINPVWSRY